MLTRDRATGILPQAVYQVQIYTLLRTTAVMSLVLVGVWGSVSTFAVLSLGFWFDRIGRRNALVSFQETSHAFPLLTSGACSFYHMQL
jgi:hypothetical protein